MKGTTDETIDTQRVFIDEFCAPSRFGHQLPMNRSARSDSAGRFDERTATGAWLEAKKQTTNSFAA
jgi:hypothetical protein